MKRALEIARHRGGDGGALACLLVMHCKLCHGLDRVVDLDAWDEAQYLRLGVESLQHALPADGLLYYGWYWLLAQVSPDRIALYDLNHALLLGLPAYLLYMLLRRLHHAPLLSLFGAGGFMISPANTVVWPYITAFSLTLVLATAIALTLPLTAAARDSLVVVASCVLSYVRPENLVLLMAAVALAVCSAVRCRKRRHVRELAWLGAAMLLVFGAGAWVGSPYSAQRARVAFSQHYALQHARRVGGPADFSPWLDSAAVMRGAFGVDSASVLEATRRNPHAVTQHVAANARSLRAWRSSQLLPHSGRATNTQTALVDMTLVLLALRWLRRRDVDVVWIWLGGHAALGLSCALVIFPRDHYLLIPACLAFAWATQLLSEWPRTWRHRGLGWAAACGLVWVTPFALHGAPGIVPPVLAHHTDESTLRNRIRVLSVLPRHERWQLLSAYPGIAAFLPMQVATTDFDGQASFETLLNRARIDLIWLDPALHDIRQLQQDTGFQRFQADPAHYGFSLRETGIPGEQLYVKRDAPHE